MTPTSRRRRGGAPSERGKNSYQAPNSARSRSTSSGQAARRGDQVAQRVLARTAATVGCAGRAPRRTGGGRRRVAQRRRRRRGAAACCGRAARRARRRRARAAARPPRASARRRCRPATLIVGVVPPGAERVAPSPRRVKVHVPSPSAVTSAAQRSRARVGAGCIGITRRTRRRGGPRSTTDGADGVVALAEHGRGDRRTASPDHGLGGVPRRTSTTGWTSRIGMRPIIASNAYRPASQSRARRAAGSSTAVAGLGTCRDGSSRASHLRVDDGVKSHPTASPSAPSCPPPLAPLGRAGRRNLRWSWHPRRATCSPPSTPSVVGGRPARPGPPARRGRRPSGSPSSPPTRRSSARPQRPRRPRSDYLTDARWYQRADGGASPTAIAYFSPEFGITAGAAAVLRRPRHPRRRPPQGGLRPRRADRRRRPALPARLLPAVAVPRRLAAGALPRRSTPTACR